MKEVFEGSLWEAELVKGLLQAEKVECMLRDETLGVVTSPYLTLGGNVKILVNDKDFLRAISIVNAR
ncbi:MAG: DUF2007 domain-containing protein [Bacteroidaceae bacterium]|nr:DUF2007 domain-containing protein [Bacteroidaceae bacterium]